MFDTVSSVMLGTMNASQQLVSDSQVVLRDRSGVFLSQLLVIQDWTVALSYESL